MTAQAHFKKIGKLKKGTKFIDKEQEFIITKSGFGSGRHVSVEFEKVNDKNSPTYCMPKTSEVQVLSNK